ncbi:unnamed protein product [Adineta steineri]|uniref:Uncharacterized protein n=1 Tax=Adineta steineri TaxID=433720 RepID=A0A814WN75_9BILA|nr:unnamed protein product [Adineta steineri]CAF3569397.1 unnamed protein product [Adineta steineri]
MYMPHSLDAYNHSPQSSRFQPRFKRSSNDDEQIVKSDLSHDIKSRSNSSSPSIKMHQQTTNSNSDESNIGVPNRLCSVCGDVSTGIHFGGNSCESCKAFFRRSVQCNRHQNYKCSNNEQCPVNIVTRKVCQYCRYIKCTAIGMKPKWVLTDQERAEKYGSRRKRFRDSRTVDEDPEIYKHLTKDEKTLIEDIAHALYQSRATYPLQFPAELNQYLTILASGKAPPSPASPGEKPPSPSANFLIVPIQRFVLFARMLKDFDLFSEDDKVNLLKGAAIEVVVCSSNTLFNPKTHTFTNYLSRDQRAVMDNQIMPLDPLLKKTWGEEIFNRTKTFLVSMCNLQVDEVTSTLLAPVILFSPDRSNIKDLDLVKRLQIKYVTLIGKYMNWRYGVEHTEHIFPKLLLQIVNIRTLGVAHAEVIQKLMSISSVNPLVQEVTTKQDISNTATTDKMNSVSLPSTPSNSEMMDYDRAPSRDTESNIGSDEDDSIRMKSRTSLDDDDRDYENDDSNETNPRNIWRKRRKLSPIIQVEPTKMEPDTLPKPLHQHIKQELIRSNSVEFETYSSSNPIHKRPHDHQVPSFIPTAYQDDINILNRASPNRHLPPKKQSLLTKQKPLHEQIYRPHSSSTSDLTSFDQHHPHHHHARLNQLPSSPLTKQHYPNNSYEDYHQQYSRLATANFQQKQNEQHLLLLSLANNQNQTSSNTQQSHPNTQLDAEEQQLLNAIHAHPNKRDLVLNLLRQMNESPSAPTMNFPENSNYPIHQQQLQQQQQQPQQQHRFDTSANYDPYRQNSNMDNNNDFY